MTPALKTLIEDHIVATNDSLTAIRDELKRRGVCVLSTKKTRALAQAAQRIQTTRRTSHELA